MKAKYLASILIVLAVFTLVACGGGSNDVIDGETLLNQRCGSCHGLDRVTSAQKTESAWDQTVTQMVEKGATLTAEEQTILVNYLAETYGP